MSEPGLKIPVKDLPNQSGVIFCHSDFTNKVIVLDLP